MCAPTFLRIPVCLLLLAFLSPSLSVGSSEPFLRNDGQVDSQILFYADGELAGLGFTRDGILVDLRQPVPPRVDPAGDGLRAVDPIAPTAVPREAIGCVVAIRFIDANRSVVVEGNRTSDARYNYFVGDDPAKWHTDVPSFAEVIYKDLRPGIDLRFSMSDGSLVYEAMPRGDAALPTVVFAYEGAQCVEARPDGTTRITTSVGELLHVRSDGNPLTGEFRIFPSARTDPEFGDRFDPTTMEWSTFLGGSASEEGWAITLDDQDRPIIAGWTESPNFPTTPGAYDTDYNAELDGFVAKLSAAGDELIWCTYLGGEGADLVFEVQRDLSGSTDLYLTGRTESADFPTTAAAFDTSHNGWADAFLTRLSGDGDALVWSSFLGGFDYDRAGGLAVDPSGAATITGVAYSSDFPTTPGAYDTSHNGGFLWADVFVSRFTPDGTALVWSTYLGGHEDWEFGETLALDSAGNVVVAGPTMSGDFPTTEGAFDTTYDGDWWEGFVSKLSASGSELLWSTFLGGEQDDLVYGVVLGASGDVFVAGQSGSGDFPTTEDAFDRFLGGTFDAFVTRLASDATTLRWSTFVGGSSWDRAEGIALDPLSHVWIVGSTDSENFPTTPDGYSNLKRDYRDAIVARLDPSGSELTWGTYLGGNGGDEGLALVVRDVGELIVTGSTSSNWFPVTEGAYDEGHNGGRDTFVTSFIAGYEQDCFFLDFDDDDDPYTLRTELPNDTQSALVRIVLEVPIDSPRGEEFVFEITEDCCDNDEGIGHYGVRFDHESVTFDPAVVEEFLIDVPTGDACAPWSIEGRFAMAPLPPPESRLFIGEAWVEVVCAEEEPPCDPSHGFQGLFEVLAGSTCGPNVAVMETACPPAGIGETVRALETLELNLPNPIEQGRSIPIRLRLLEDSHVRLQLYDVAGRLVDTLVEGWIDKGSQAIAWDASRLPRGVYFLRLDAQGTQQNRMIVVGP